MMKSFFLTCFLLISVMSGYKVYAEEALIPDGKILVNGQLVHSIADAQKLIVDGASIYIGNGTYADGLHIKHNNVILSGSTSTHFKSAAILGKGTFVVSGNNVTIENIECSGVTVSSNNGACIRQEGKNLTLTNVNFHDSQQGILSGKDTGQLLIQYSKFERLGLAGRAHAIYSANDELIIRHSIIINSVDQGHEVKSRAALTIIENSVIGSHDTNDSRAIDISNGGELKITNSVIFQGSKTVNRQLIGYGLETLGRKRTHSVKITKSLLILERNAANEMLALPKANSRNLSIQVYNNTIIGENIIDIELYRSNNLFKSTRAKLGFQEQTIPNLKMLEQVMYAQ